MSNLQTPCRGIAAALTLSADEWERLCINELDVSPEEVEQTFEWFRREDWSTFTSWLRPDVDAWGHRILRRGLDAHDRLGRWRASPGLDRRRQQCVIARSVL